MTRLVWKSITTAGLMLAAALLSAARVQAYEVDVAAAAGAFARAQEAELRGAHALAASQYELADRISPTPEALRSATRARLAAGQLASAAIDAEELKRRYPDDPQSVKMAEEVLKQARGRLARVTVRCPPECRVVIDGLAVDTEARPTHIAFVYPGSHTIQARFSDGGTASERIVVDGPGELHIVKLEEPLQEAQAAFSAEFEPPRALSGLVGPSSSQDRSPSSSGLPPAVGLVLGGSAMLLGGVAGWSAWDARRARDDFAQNPTREAFNAGKAKDLRTNILMGTSAAAGTLGLSLLLFATDWSGHSEGRRASAVLKVSPLPHASSFSLEGEF